MRSLLAGSALVAALVNGGCTLEEKGSWFGMKKPEVATETPQPPQVAVQVIQLYIEGRVSDTLCFAKDFSNILGKIQPKGSGADRIILHAEESVKYLMQPACIHNLTYQPGVCQEGAYILPLALNNENRYIVGSIEIQYTDLKGNKKTINPTGGITQYNFGTWEQGKKIFMDKCTIHESVAKGKKK